MLDKRTAFEEAILHFPRWMDIRKRKNTSEGGKLLRSVIDELEGLQMAEEDFRKSFFIVNYLGREEEIMDYLYEVKAGAFGNALPELLLPKMEVTEDMEKFYKSKDDIALYQEGVLLFKTMPEDIKEVRYSINGFTYGAEAKKISLWNVFDEFALFAGVTRYEDEKNSTLLRRSLMAFRRKANVTGEGLANAVANALIPYEEISPDEIKISGLNDSDLFLEDEDFGTLIERLAEINRDTFRTKTWDANNWEHHFKKLSYAPIPWDISLEDIQDGVGQGEDLKSAFLSEMDKSEGTDVSIDLYEKSEVKINEYIRNRRIETDIDLKLVKYANVLKPKEVEYKITATSAVEIGKENIHIDCHKITTGERDYHVSDLVLNKDEIKDITVERGALRSDRKYRLKFVSKVEYGTMEMSRAMLSSTSGQQSLLIPRGSFGVNKNGIFENTNVKKHVTSLGDFARYENIRKTVAGFSLDNSAKDGYAVLDVSDCGGQYVMVNTEVQETSITHNTSFVNMEGNLELTPENQIVSNGREGKITIQATCNQLSFRMISGNCVVTKTIDGIQAPSEIWYDTKSESLKFDSEKDVLITIQKMNNSVPLVVDNIRYARYSVNYKLESKDLIRTQMGVIIPNLQGAKENLIVSMKSFSGFSPIVKFIHVGANIKNAEYRTDIFSGALGAKLDVEANCEVELEVYDLSGSLVSTTKPFVSKSMYQNNKTAAVYLEMDTSKFESLKKSTPSLEKMSHQGRLSSWIKLMPGEIIDTIKIDGDVRTLISRVKLNELLRSNQTDEIYAAPMMKGFIVKSATAESLKLITQESLGIKADSYTVHGLPVGMRSIFVVDAKNNIESIGTSHSLSFESFYIVSSPLEHVGYNRTRMIRPRVNGVEIVDMFTPLVPINTNMIYVVEPGENGESKSIVMFEHAARLEKWSLGRKTLLIENDIDASKRSNYETETVEIRKKAILGNNIDLEEEITVGQQVLNLGEYIVTPPAEMKIIQESRLREDEVIYAQEDGFNKLKYSNISQIKSIRRENGEPVSVNDYSLLGEEGILAWNNPSLIGEKITLSYQYGIPRFLVFTSLDRLYQMVGYKVDAYKFTESLYFDNVREDFSLDDAENNKLRAAARVLTKSSNPNYNVQISNSAIRLLKVNEEDKVAVRNGYVYQNGQELYRYSHRSENLLQNMAHVELIDTERQQGLLLTDYTSTNYLPDSSMKPRRMAKLATYKASSYENSQEGFGRIGACDDFNYWNVLEMNLSFVDGMRGKATKFTPTSEFGFAMMDITSRINQGDVISFYTDGNIKAFISKGIIMAEETPEASVIAGEAIPMAKLGNYTHFEFKEKIEGRYFLILKGTGTMDDVLISPLNGESLEMRHQNVLDKLGLSIEEKPVRSKRRKLYFDARGNESQGIEITEDNGLKLSSTAQWGLTKVYEAKEPKADMSLRHMKIVKERYLLSEGNDSYMETSPVYLRATGAIRRLFIGVNEWAEGSMKDLTISVYTAEKISGPYKLAAEEMNVNQISITGDKLNSYIRIRVAGEKGKIVSSVHAYAEYLENETMLRIGDMTSGAMISKVYDIGEKARIRVIGIESPESESLENIGFSVRGKRENSADGKWTDWKSVPLDEEMNVTGIVEFDGYEFIQYKISLQSPAEIRIKSIILEVE